MLHHKTRTMTTSKQQLSEHLLQRHIRQCALCEKGVFEGNQMLLLVVVRAIAAVEIINFVLFQGVTVYKLIDGVGEPWSSTKHITLKSLSFFSNHCFIAPLTVCLSVCICIILQTRFALIDHNRYTQWLAFVQRIPNINNENCGAYVIIIAQNTSTTTTRTECESTHSLNEL